MFSKILIANRGEIALRIIRACRELGIRTVAVYSEPDRSSQHVRFADEAICIGQAASAKSYLNIPAIISAAEITDVEAIHPGYGFLAENPHFAEICESCHIKFIGPTPENIRNMGDKMNARTAMQKAGLPVVPGSSGSSVKSKEEALKIAQRIGYPVIIKACAGGGGKGMRICHNDIKLATSLLTAQSEAEANFGNPAVYIEKYLEKPRHVEIQLIADSYGNAVYLGERDCSIQRRHQKLLEESPSPAVDAKMRKRLGEMAVKAVKAVGYVNAGTMEFLLDSRHNFYFMEMNTRIQVEHPVTELVTGIDLIKEQIKVAAGEKLGFKQEDIRIQGHAIECRINAEDFENNFMPCPGKIEVLNLPGGPGIRVDTHIYQGYTISPHYDSMVAKLIAHGKTREETIQILQRALVEFTISPIKTTIPFHQRLLEHPLFKKSEISTHFVQDVFLQAQEPAAEQQQTGA